MDTQIIETGLRKAFNHGLIFKAVVGLLVGVAIGYGLGRALEGHTVVIPLERGQEV